MSRKALGRGLSALLSDVHSKLETIDELREVDIDLIDPNPDQPRTVFTEEKLEELSQSIRENGLVQPILLRRRGNGRYQIIAGERRWRATQRLGVQKVNAVIRDIGDEKLLELALIENIQRQELNPIEEAAAYQRLMDIGGLTQDEVAKRIGKDRSSVANYIRLLKLPLSVQRMLEEESISMGHARALLGLDREEEQSKLAQVIVEKKLSVRETEREVQRKSKETEGNSESSQLRRDANVRAAELKLKRFLGTQVKILMGARGGKINIEFSSALELDRIYSILMRKMDPPIAGFSKDDIHND